MIITLYKNIFLPFFSAEIMKNGGICGMPTDTVYVLVAACNRPDAVVKAYKSVFIRFYFLIYIDLLTLIAF